MPADSRRAQMRKVYECITELTSPGDVVFFVSERSVNLSLSILRQIYRRWIGFADEDNSRWHTAMYTQARKESCGSTVRPYFIHAVEKGVEEIYIPPSYFTSVYADTGEMIQNGRIEILKNPDITIEQRTEMVRYIHQRLGQPFSHLDWKQDILTWALGIPAWPLDPNHASCHGIIFDAYEHAGCSFAHHLETAPVFNIGRHLGHPIGEDPKCANLKRLHLHDHHLYRDQRFKCVLSVFEDGEGVIRIAENPGKYSWNPALKQKYKV